MGWSSTTSCLYLWGMGYNPYTYLSLAFRFGSNSCNRQFEPVRRNLRKLCEVGCILQRCKQLRGPRQVWISLSEEKVNLRSFCKRCPVCAFATHRWKRFPRLWIRIGCWELWGSILHLHSRIDFYPLFGNFPNNLCRFINYAICQLDCCFCPVFWISCMVLN